jgi:hypothetical protein
MTIYTVIAAIPFVVMLLMIWLLVFEGAGLPQKIRCKIGGHGSYRHVDKMETKLGMGFFGGPVTYFNWHCDYCGKRGFD